MAQYFPASGANFGGGSPTGNFIPQIYSKNVLLKLRRGSVVDSITNNDYFGEIAAFGDTVKIINEPVITINDYTRGLTLASDTLTDTQKTIIIDQAKYWQFTLDDIETTMSHIGWQAMVQNQAAYQLMQSYDNAILAFMSDPTNVLAANVMNDDEHANLIDLSSADALLDHITDMSVLLSLQDVVSEGRYLVLPHSATGTLSKIDSKLINADFNGGAANLQSTPAYAGMLRGFQLYITNNSPTYSTLTTVHTHERMLAGHISAVSTAQTILNTEVRRSNTTFGDIIRGQHVYGRGIIRPESLVVAGVKFDATA